nr:hypothetical transcript [Hymenolepis microstoma]
MSHVGRSARKKILVQSRYRSASVSRRTVSASSPNRDTLPSFSINDSVASSIPSWKLNTSLSSRTASKQSPFLSDEELIKWSNRTIWKFLALKSRRALESQVDQEVTLRKTIMQKRVNDGWFKQWLVNQKSLDEEIKTCLEQQQKGLDLLSQQMSELSRVVQTSTAWTANREDVLSKFIKVSRLFLHLASLHAHRRQLEIIEKIDSLFL